MDKLEAELYPMPVARTLDAAKAACGGAGVDGAACHGAAMLLADALTYYIGAVAVAQYSQALYTGLIGADPTLSRSLRQLRRVLSGQWLGWAARGLAATPTGPVEGMAGWYEEKHRGAPAQAYETLRGVMVERLGYTGEYGQQASVSPRLLLEMVDQYRIRRSKAPADGLPEEIERRVGEAVLHGLEAALEGARFLKEYELYAPQQRQRLMGLKPTTPLPPLTVPPDADAAATLLLYPPGEAPDYTKRPNLQQVRLPLFPLDPLLAYLHCPTCNRPRVAALRAVANNTPEYVGLDPECGHGVRNE